jgi:hypothetical protein
MFQDLSSTSTLKGLNNLPDHKAWWTSLANERVVLHVLMGSVCLSLHVCMVDLGEIT